MKLSLLAAVVVLAAAGCGGGGSKSAATTTVTKIVTATNPTGRGQSRPTAGSIIPKRS